MIITEPRPIGIDPGDADHLVCCDPDTALCGADVSDLPPPTGRIETADLCRLCVIAEENGMGCGGCSP